jgi:hypothetical protein
MGVEKFDNATLATDPVTGRPLHPTNMGDVERDGKLPPAEMWVDCPPGYSHGAPDTHNPYQTGKRSLPPKEINRE